MRNAVLAAALLTSVIVPFAGSAGTASASGHDTELPTPPDDLGILLTDMFAAMADILAAKQEQTANESHLGSHASKHRLQSAILQAPDVTLRRGARPFVEGWLLDDD